MHRRLNLENFWRRKPFLRRKFVEKHTIEELSGSFPRSCAKPAVSRLFIGPSPLGVGTSRLVPDPAEAWRLFQRFRHTAPVTVLLNKMDVSDRKFSQLRELFSVPF